MAQNFCKACGAELIPGKEFCPKCLVRVPVIPLADIRKQVLKDTPENREKKLKEYKVLQMTVSILQNWGNVINPQKMEEKLNSYASEGWKVVSLSTGNPGNFSDYIIILERDIPLEP